jgi:magnesium chelatase subunit H
MSSSSASPSVSLYYFNSAPLNSEYMRLPEHLGGIGSQAVIHCGMHGTEEWLPGQPLGNDRQSWSDELIGDIPNLYIYAANNPSESILAKRRGYGTLISYNVPPYGRAGLYLELANLKDLVSEYRSAEATDEASGKSSRNDLRGAIWTSCQRCEITNDVPLLVTLGDKSSALTEADIDSSISDEAFDAWIIDVADYLIELQDRLFSSGLHTLGSTPSDEDLKAYLNAYFGEKLPLDAVDQAIAKWHNQRKQQESGGAPWFQNFSSWLKRFTSEFGMPAEGDTEPSPLESEVEETHEAVMAEAENIIDLLSRNTEELDAVITGLDGGYIPPKPGGDLLRDGVGVLPTGKNIHALDRKYLCAAFSSSATW